MAYFFPAHPDRMTQISPFVKLGHLLTQPMKMGEESLFYLAAFSVMLEVDQNFDE